MGSKTIGIGEDVYERLRARKRDDESFTDLVDRLLDESVPGWREHFGTLPVDDTAELEAIAAKSRERAGGGAAARQQRAFDAMTDVEESDTE